MRLSNSRLARAQASLDLSQRGTPDEIAARDLAEMAAWEPLRRRAARAAHPITVKRLGSGYFHIRGVGPCNWAQPPYWPCDEPTFREHVFHEAGEEFIDAALESRPWGRCDGAPASERRTEGVA